ncbi:unnamed protein product [Rotaria sp. Silwood2]|nr:unnamed protein product [Rotaria sp. Silwood2]
MQTIVDNWAAILIKGILWDDADEESIPRVTMNTWDPDDVMFGSPMLLDSRNIYLLESYLISNDIECRVNDNMLYAFSNPISSYENSWQTNDLQTDSNIHYYRSTNTHALNIYEDGAINGMEVKILVVYKTDNDFNGFIN